VSDLALHTDLYQLTMAAGYFHRGFASATATCEMFVRRLPKARRYLVAMGIERALDYLTELHFTEAQIEFLRTVPALRDAMTPAFEDYLRAFRFTGDVDAVPEGTIVLPNEPFVRVRAPIIEAQLVETYLLSAINHATMVASKAARVVQSAKGRACIEFGTRRTHPEAALDAARAAYAVGFSGTSNVEAGLRFGIPVQGTAAHMWTMAHPSEEAAFEGYVAVFPSASILLIDTYDTVRGAERAAKIAKDKLRGVRLDSGDLDALSRAVRAVLDANGCQQTKIVASGDLNELKIEALVAAGAPIDLFGVGTDLVASIDAPALGGVYKLVAIERDGVTKPIAKLSEGKATWPGPHQVLRELDANGVMLRDHLVLDGERGQGTPLLEPRVRDGARTTRAEDLTTIRARAAQQLATLPEAMRSLAPRADGEAPTVDVVVSASLQALLDEVRATHR
jgi:nicotinate phosphoribosyltransferase